VSRLGEPAQLPTGVKKVLTPLVNSIETMFAGVWEGPTGCDADSPARRYNPHEIATWGRS
jgi:hypothetical protein